MIKILLLLATTARASDDAEGLVTYKQKTEIDFEDLEIEGTLQKPQSALVLERKKASFNPLIKIRENWDPEMDKSIDYVK